MGKLPPGGAEIPSTLLFADVRGWTGLAEQSSATEFAALLRRFYAVGSQAVIDERGIVDKFVGDEVVALYIRPLPDRGTPSPPFEAPPSSSEALATERRRVPG